GKFRPRLGPPGRGGRGRHAGRVRRRPRVVRRGRARGSRLSARASAMTEIRAASPGDADRLAELRWEFRAGRAPVVESRDAFVRRCAAWMARELAPEHAWRAWVAVSDGAMV